MKKNFKLIILSLILLVSGCGNTDLKKYSDNMSFKKIDGYILDLRISGEYKNRNVNDVIRIYNYKNEQLRIVSSPDIDRIYSGTENSEIVKSLVYQNKKVYTETSDYKYKETENEIVYKNTDIFLKSIDSVNRVIKNYKEKIGDKEYSVFEVEYKKSTIEKILKSTEYNDLKINNKILGKVYIENDKVYKIYFEVEKLNVTASYFGINMVSKMEID